MTEPPELRKKLLVLDLDETLMLATETPLSFRQPDFQHSGFFVYERPLVRDFLHFAQITFEIGVWTSSTALYALPIVDFLFGNSRELAFVWCRERCSLKYSHEMMEHYYIKPFRKLKRKGYNLETVLAVDDSPHKHVANYGNLVRIREYDGSLADRELLFLQQYLASIKDVANVRALEKRWWRDGFS
ncbi:MAG: HAD family hydrolase [Blastocatellia bacterium]|nr:HAD family hydrolase [Blastocatellia bacterium]